jgi:hypothetical protein
MMDLYRVQFAHPQAPETNAVPESPTTICTPCAAGHHEQIVLGGESCDCPCHGTTPDCTDYKVAAA